MKIKFFFKFVMVLFLSLSVLTVTPQVYAASPGSKEAQAPGGPRRHLANIVFSGLAGAVLGLSTLSFYGRPQDRLANIAVGFAVGIIGGTLFTTYKAAAEPREFYGLEEYQPQAWQMIAEGSRRPELNTPSASVTFEF